MRSACLLLLMLSSLAAQPKVEAIVSEKRLVEGQSFQLEVRVTDGLIQSVTIDGFDDFRLVSGPSSSRSVQIINGAVSSVSSRTWTLRPKRVGQLVIPPIAVRVDDATRYTKPVGLNVVRASAAASGGSQGQSGSIFLVAEVDQTQVYRGEQLTVTWTLYTQLNISGWEIVSLPSMPGFWAEDLFAPNKLQLRERVRDGTRYYSAVVRRMALFPTRSGDLEIDPMVLKIGVQVQRRNRRDPFFKDFSFLNPGRVENREVPSPTVSIQVKPIPARNRPDGYAGLVGRYSLTGGLDYGEVVEDEAVTLSLTISGEGNFKALAPPIIDFPQGLEVFDPRVINESSLGDIIGGTRTLEYVIIPRGAETFVIPRARLPYFNPDKGRYEVSTVGPFTLKVLPREGKAASTTGFSRREVALMGKDIRFVKSERPRWLKTGAGRYTTGLLLLNLATVFLFAAPWMGHRVRSLATVVIPTLKVRRALPSALSIIGKAQGDPSLVYGQFSLALTVYLNRKLGRDSQEYVREDVMALLADRGIPQTYREMVAQVLEHAAAARFAPMGAGDVEADRQALREALTQVEAHWSA